MSLRDQVQSDMKEAMRAREAGRTRLSAVRMLWASIRNREIDVKHELGDAEVVEVCAREVRQREEALPDYERSGREELVARMREEIEVLRGYLPPPVDAQAIRELARARIEAVGAAGPRDLGRVMGPLMQELKGRADGAEVQRIVRELLGG